MAYEDLIADANLQGHWDLQDDAASTVIVNEAGTNGVLVGGDNTSALTTTGPGGAFLKALAFDGSNDYITVPDTAIASSGAYSICVRAKPADIGTRMTVFGDAASGSRFIQLTNARTYARSNTETSVEHGVDVADWHTFAWVRRADNLTDFYVDGALVLADANAGSAAFTFNLIGAYSASFQAKFNGALCNVLIFDRELTTEEVGDYHDGPSEAIAPLTISTNTAGSLVSFVFGETVTGSTGLSLVASGEAVTLSSVTGSGTNTLTGVPSRTLYARELIRATAAASDIENGAGGVAEFADVLVANNSTQEFGRDENGWTSYPLPAGARTIYVSATGNDSNDGLSDSTPKLTVAAGKALIRAGFGDQLLFKRGDTWTDENLGTVVSGKSITEPTVIGAYGTGARPKFLASTATEWSKTVNDRSYHAFIGLHLEPNDRENNDADKNGLEINTNAYGCLLVEDCYISGFRYNLTTSAANGYEWGSLCVRRNVITNAWSGVDRSQGMYTVNVRGALIEENIFDHNGWYEGWETADEPMASAEPDIYSHNIYVQNNVYDLTIRNNIFARGASMGLKMDSDQGVFYIDENLFVQNGFACQFGEGSDDIGAEVDGCLFYIQDNVMVEGRALANANGLGPYFQNVLGGYFRRNLLGQRNASIGGTGGWGVVLTDLTDGVGINNLDVDSNVIYDWNASVEMQDVEQPSSPEYTTTTVSGNTFRRNKLVATQGAEFLVQTAWTNPAEITYSDNQYYHHGDAADEWFEVDGTPVSTATWQSTYEPTATFANPSFPDPTRTVTTYATGELELADFDELVDLWKLQRNGNWTPEVHAAAINEWIRAGFGMGADPPGDGLSRFVPRFPARFPARFPTRIA